MLASMRQFKAGVFQALAHPTRIAIVEYLQRGELTVGRLCEKLNLEQANVSQHLAVLRNKRLVESRKQGNQIFYRLCDPRFGQVLETLRQYFLSHISEVLVSLRDESAKAEAQLLEEEAE